MADRALSIRVRQDGSILLPASLRRELGINVGDEVILQIEHEELRITTFAKRLERAQRLVRQHVKEGTSLADELIAERRSLTRK